ARRFDVPDARDIVNGRMRPNDLAARTANLSRRLGRTRITRTRAALGAVASLLVVFSAVAAVLIHSGVFTAHAAVGAPSGVTVAWGDSTGLVRWPAVGGATGYEVTLIRTSDKGIMQQFKTPATQLAADVQALWYGEHYEVAVQAIDGNGKLGAASLSSVGASSPISRATYNGFLDQENRSAGAIDPNLWDMRIYDGFEANYGVTFVNGQMHYHLETGDPNGHQTLATMRARVPIDWSGRTATIHGEVDLKGTFHNWFAAVLSPQATGPDRILDLVDRGYSPRTMPQLELFDDQDGLHLLYADGNHTAPRDLGHVPNPINLSNVRDDIVWKVSDTQVQVMLDGQSALNVTLPSTLAFSHGYLTLAAEDYPGSTGGVHPPTACDAVMADCNLWHLDNWGFDAASGQQPLTTAYYANGCGPYPTTPKGSDFAPTASVECGSRTVTVATTSNLTGAAISFEAKRPGNIQVSVNGGAWHTANYIANDVNIYNGQDYIVPISPSELQSGDNTVSYQLGGGMSAFNTEIETISSTPYVAPAEPAEPAPLGTWGGSVQSSSTAPGTATPTATTTQTAIGTQNTPGAPVAINKVPCTVMINGQQVSGTCSGTFTSSSTGAPTPTPNPNPTSTPASTPTPTVTSTSTPTPIITNGGRQAGINVEPSMRPFRYNGPNPDSWWCVQPNCFQNSNPMTTINDELSLAQQLGVSVVRIEFPWALIEPGNGVYDWSRADAIVNAANAHGIQLQPIIVYTPKWINSDPTQPPTASEFSSFVSALVGRYHNSIHYWEMWNEPNLVNYWAASEQSYVSNILVPGYAATKAA
ncbi:MAG TPA: endo-1,4-beta-xylanase, partial [Ktedonobacterales bacterium]|nr:endo-1,4-beta-xylanase [Ktedonobacterales bacterium]